MAGLTVLRGVLGFGATGRPHTASLLRVSDSLPLVIEVVDSEERIAALWPSVEELFTTRCLITKERVHVLRYN